MRAAACLLLLVLVAAGAGVARAADEPIVAWATMEDARAALLAAGLPEPADNTADPRFPGLRSDAGDKAGIQITLMACGSDERCLGAQLIATIPATEQRYADIIVGSIEHSVAGFDAVAIAFADAQGDMAHAVQIKGYLMFDYGVSPTLLPDMTAYLRGIVEQTKDFMLQDDPAHADLWRTD